MTYTALTPIFFVAMLAQSIIISLLVIPISKDGQ